jgi:hypothetical protein
MIDGIGKQEEVEKSISHHFNSKFHYLYRGIYSASTQTIICIAEFIPLPRKPDKILLVSRNSFRHPPRLIWITDISKEP